MKVGPSPARARATIRGVVWLQALANGLGVITVWAYFAFLLPGSEGGRMESSTINLVVFGSYTAVMVLLALPVNALLLRRWRPAAASHPEANTETTA